MDESPQVDRTKLDALAAAEQELLTIIEQVAADGALTEDDRQQMSFEAEMLVEELRACVDPSKWE
ncbi:hypothetical protein [Halomarina litorea]|uniref:hypothetical protein n=1 Tax=Halomarina litorea TaxID=2961595 RepID=UPI0020C5B36A|nr:hypothetical protein [Halomarina sp. BCD28]